MIRRTFVLSNYVVKVFDDYRFVRAAGIYSTPIFVEVKEGVWIELDKLEKDYPDIFKEVCTEMRKAA